MSRNYYIISGGRLKRKENTIYFENKNEKRAIPINDIYSIYVYGEIELNTKLLNYLTQKKIPIHFFNYYGYYSGSYYPREYLNSGFLLVNQVKHYIDDNKRMTIAKEIVHASTYNIIKNLKYYEKHNKQVSEQINEIQKCSTLIDKTCKITELMSIEGKIRQIYYSSFNNILRSGFQLQKRVKRPPDNMVNCLISFGNSMLYATTLSEIYNTQLNPTISYLHEPGERRFSLSLDLSEVFKPLIVDKTIFSLINNRKIKSKHFLKELNYCYLNKKGREIFITEYENKLKTTIMHKKLKRKTSYQRLIRLECYKLIKHLLNEKKYDAFKIWW
ncbi:MAG: type I-B CRISPR-associated endonuclease Cas1b [Candidatus Odinarchaeia archaeon]